MGLSWAAIGAVGGGIIGSIVPGIGTAAGAAIGAMIGGGVDANSANSANQQAAEAYDTSMSDTSYQRGMADMEAAGLNPILAYSQGGASTPTISPITFQNVASGVPSAVATAQATTAQTAKLQADTLSSQASLSLVPMQAALLKAQTQAALAAATASSATAANAQASLGMSQAEGDVGGGFHQAVVDTFAPAFSSAKSAVPNSTPVVPDYHGSSSEKWDRFQMGVRQ